MLDEQGPQLRNWVADNEAQVPEDQDRSSRALIRAIYAFEHYHGKGLALLHAAAQHPVGIGNQMEIV